MSYNKVAFGALLSFVKDQIQLYYPIKLLPPHLQGSVHPNPQTHFLVVAGQANILGLTGVLRFCISKNNTPVTGDNPQTSL